MFFFVIYLILVLNVLADYRSVIHTANRYDYVVSIPDVHGDLEILIRSLWMAQVTVEKKSQENLSFDDFHKLVVDAMKKKDDLSNFHESSSRVLLIQTGDIVDRGPASLSCYRALWAAARDVLKWDLVNLFGNHEVMSMAGQADHYAHPGDVKEFGSLAARRNEFATGGKLWTQLTTKFQFMVKVVAGDEKVLFVHAGISPKYLSAVKSRINGDGDIVAGLNKLLLNEVIRDPSSELLVSANSPIWTRDMAQGSDKQICKNMLPAVMRMMDVTRIVVGHTPQETLVTGNRCKGRLLLADVAMSRWMGSGHNGNPSVVVFSLAENGGRLDRIENLYWKGEVVGNNGKIVEDVLVSSEDFSGENPEL